MNEYFEITSHWNSLVPGSYDPYKFAVIRKKNGEKYKNQDKYAAVDISDLMDEINLIDWQYAKKMKKSHTCPYCRINTSTTRDHIISAFHRRCAKYQYVKMPNYAKLIIMCCGTCNVKKGNKYPSEWLSEINKIIEKGPMNQRAEYYMNIRNSLNKIMASAPVRTA